MKVTHSAAASAAPSSQPTLRIGAKGGAVTNLQQRLRSAGYNISADGDFGPRTQAAVRAFQKKHGLVPDGVVGPKTWAKLGVGGSAPAGGSSGSGPLLRSGARGLPVAQLQNRLNQLGFNVGAADGTFGPKTAAGVKAFQKSRGLAADGVVGPKTWSKLGIHASGSVSNTGGGTGVNAGGGWGGTEGLAGAAKSVAAQMGLRVTSTKRTAAGSIGSSTGSDHHVSQTNAYAVDIGVAGSKGTELAHRLAKTYGLKPPYIGTYNKHYINVNGQQYRVQLLWQVAGHYDHVHIGFRRV